ncbi:hypothetical protein B0T16DRAFT_95834 [Cercophora newfieldiana]|uniref:Uncharacterized protein n=1 Tax=Cercophora newfieldiana TaxID=92897 RepID=A0AA39YGK3_9PEZI|nr:hypothetical protein B0T16DRAFT_95834 [Cercophora newfieldiana]
MRFATVMVLWIEWYPLNLCYWSAGICAYLNDYLFNLPAAAWCLVGFGFWLCMGSGQHSFDNSYDRASGRSGEDKGFFEFGSDFLGKCPCLLRPEDTGVVQAVTVLMTLQPSQTRRLSIVVF